MYSPRKIHLGGSILANKTFFVCGPKFTGLFSCNVGGIAVNRISFRFWVSGAIPEILAIKVENCQKSRWILDVCSPSQILGGQHSENYTNVMTPASRHVVRKLFCGDIPTSLEVVVANTLNFKPNFIFSRLNFFAGTLIPIWVRAIKTWSISSAYKTLRGQHPLRASTP